MKIGLFDHVEHGKRPLATLFDERLAFAKAADEAGIYCLHVAEHHATPLNMVPVPGVYLGAVARATKRMRLGPLVYLLPLYSPLRLIEEICILDHLSHGRMEVGVGAACRRSSSNITRSTTTSRAISSSMRSTASPRD
jgi:alkanesulfonate monooxygenase SsuD/methylene tetrahydromethanopterin reductase-like flavin-dependent oxidoreductase (luciferase family)